MDKWIHWWTAGSYSRADRPMRSLTMYMFIIYDMYDTYMIIVIYKIFLSPRHCALKKRKGLADILHATSWYGNAFVITGNNTEFRYFPCCWTSTCHWFDYSDVIMSTMASQITSLTILYSTVYLGVNQRNRQSSASLAFLRGIHRWPVTSPHKGPVTREMFPFDDVIMLRRLDAHVTWVHWTYQNDVQ